jgi:hypothetical protein
MKSGIKSLITGLMLSGLLLTTGCIINGQPPEHSVGNPVAVPDGSGGIVVAYQINQGNGRATYLQRLDADGQALWGEAGIRLNP